MYTLSHAHEHTWHLRSEMYTQLCVTFAIGDVHTHDICDRRCTHFHTHLNTPDICERRCTHICDICDRRCTHTFAIGDVDNCGWPLRAEMHTHLWHLRSEMYSLSHAHEHTWHLRSEMYTHICDRRCTQLCVTFASGDVHTFTRTWTHLTFASMVTLRSEEYLRSNFPVHHVTPITSAELAHTRTPHTHTHMIVPELCGLRQAAQREACGFSDARATWGRLLHFRELPFLCIYTRVCTCVYMNIYIHVYTIVRLCCISECCFFFASVYVLAFVRIRICMYICVCICNA